MPTALLVIAVLGLAVGPAVHSLGGSKVWRRAIDGLSVTLVIGLCLILLAPHALAHGGFPALVAGAVGLLFPVVLSRVGGLFTPIAAFVGLVLLVLHAVIDGAALAVSSAGGSLVLGLAVVAHRLPVSFAIVTAARRGMAAVSPLRAAWVVVGLLIIATLGGFFLGGSMVAGLPEWVEGVLEAGVVGVLLHTLVEKGDAEVTDPAGMPWSVLGSFMGLVVLVVVTAVAALPGEGQHALEHLHASSQAFIDLALPAAPALLLGFSAIALLRLLPAHLRVWEGTAPVLPLEAMTLSVPMLGAPIAVARVVLGGSFLAFERFVLRGVWPGTPRPPAMPVVQPLSVQLRRAGHEGFVKAVDRSMPWYLLGVWVAALSEPLLGHGAFDWLPSAVHVPLLTLLGLVIPGGAAGITLVAAVGLHQGLTAGSILAFVFASPAVRVVSLGQLKLSRDTVASAGVGLIIVLLALVGGWGLDLLWSPDVPSILHAEHHPARDVLHWVCFAVVGALAIGSLVRLGPRGLIGRVVSPRDALSSRARR